VAGALDAIDNAAAGSFIGGTAQVPAQAGE
jgi:hypothetical protein